MVTKLRHIFSHEFISPGAAIWLTVISLALFAGFVRLDHLTSSTNGALCTLRHDLEVRVSSSEDFLKDHPDGFAGITAATIRQSLANQKRTIHSLRNLDC